MWIFKQGLETNCGGDTACWLAFLYIPGFSAPGLLLAVGYPLLHQLPRQLIKDISADQAYLDHILLEVAFSGDLRLCQVDC